MKKVDAPLAVPELRFEAGLAAEGDRNLPLAHCRCPIVVKSVREGLSDEHGFAETRLLSRSADTQDNILSLD